MAVSSSRTGNASGLATRRILLRTAEHLFAEQGLDAVSLRQISTAAGMRMAGAVAYHFGDKAGLIRAIIDDRIPLMEKRRSAMLAELERQGRLRDIRALMEATIRPSVEAIGETGYYYRFIAQLDRHPQTLYEVRDSGAFGSATRLAAERKRALDHLTPTIREHRQRLATQLMIAALADLEALGGGEVNEAVTLDLIECVVALYSAPPPRQHSKR